MYYAQLNNMVPTIPQDGASQHQRKSSDNPVPRSTTNKNTRMFQRRMLLVANQLQNTQLTAPKLFSSSKKKNQEESNDDDDDNGNGDGGGCDVEDVDNAATDNSQTAIINNNAASAVGKATGSATITTIKSKLSAKNPSIPKDFDTAASQLLNKSLKHRNDCMKRVKRNSVHVAFVAYLLVGMGVYATDIRNTGALGSVASRVIMGYYESITIGFSVGLGTKDPDYV